MSIYSCILGTKNTSKHQIEDSFENLEGSINIWKDHCGNVGVQMDKDIPTVVLQLIGPSRYWHESSICDNLKHQKRCLEVLFVLRVCTWILISGFRTGAMLQCHTGNARLKWKISFLYICIQHDMIWYSKQPPWSLFNLRWHILLTLWHWANKVRSSIGNILQFQDNASFLVFVGLLQSDIPSNVWVLFSLCTVSFIL